MNRGVRASLLAFFVLLPLVFAPTSPAALGRIECRSMHSDILGHDERYCVILPPGYDTEKLQRFPVLYFLHGLGGNEQIFVDSGAWNLVEDGWEEGRLGHFLIVTPDGDTSFFINSFDGRVRYEDFFLREFLPFIEREYRTLPGRRNRGIAGISMGGFGALHIAFGHPELFGAVSANSPALLEKLPDVTFANPRQSPLLRILRAFGTPPNHAFWDRNNPFNLARTANLRGLKIYLDCGLQDDYGFERGARQLHELLLSRGIPHEFHLYPGGHNWLYFAAHLPTSLEFQSRAFGFEPSKK